MEITSMMETKYKNIYEAPSTKVRELLFEDIICQIDCSAGLHNYMWEDVDEE